MELNKILKIIRKLGDNYIFIPLLKNQWALYRNDSEHRLILDSTKNTEEELKKFVKEHRYYDPISTIRNVYFVINIIILISTIINLFVNSSILSNVNFGALITILISLIALSKIQNNNFNIKDKVLNEDKEYRIKIYNKLEKQMVEIDKKSTRTKRKTKNKGEEKEDK